MSITCPYCKNLNQRQEAGERISACVSEFYEQGIDNSVLYSIEYRIKNTIDKLVSERILCDVCWQKDKNIKITRYLGSLDICLPHWLEIWFNNDL